MSLPTKYLTAIQASIEASDAIVQIYQNEVQPDFKSDGSPVTIADLASSKILRTHLRHTHIPILGEEGEIPSFEERQKWTEYWCIDPLDGTKMFLQRNDEFCICIAHLKNDEPIFGMITDPMNKQVLCGGKEFGVFQFPFEDFENSTNWKKMTPPKYDSDIVIGSRSFGSQHQKWTSEVLKKPIESFRFIKKGSALKFFDLVNGNANFYLRFGPTMEWDISAGQAIVETLGGTVISLLDESRLKYNKKDLRNPPFLIQMKK